jgi:hypothetical protein
MIIDTNRRTTTHLSCLQTKGVKTIIRYYARTTRQPEKRLIRSEADAILALGLSIAVVHQAGGADVGSFSQAKGKLDAEYALKYAVETIGQPDGSAIYFAVDFDCDAAQFASNVIPHFQAIKDVNLNGGFSKQFVIGAYGNGLVLDGLLSNNLIELAWLSQSTGHHGSRTFKATNKWTLFQELPSTLCGIGVDVDELNPAASQFGQFDKLDDLPGGGNRFRSTAADGLRLRAGPGTTFEIRKLLPAGTEVVVVSRFNEWAIVDVDGDGMTDGAVHSGFLELIN